MNKSVDAKHYPKRRSDMAKNIDDKLGLNDKLARLKDEIVDSIKSTIKNETNDLRNYFESSIKEFADDMNTRLDELSLKIENNSKLSSINKINISELKKK